MTANSSIILGYDFDEWHGYGEKKEIRADISPNKNSHMLFCGMSGSGKSYMTNAIFAKLAIAGGEESKVFFADYKQDDQFSYLRDCPRYYPYERTIEALENVYDILKKRQSGEDKTRHQVTLIWDEYIANILALRSIEKKKADVVMGNVSEILMLGRSLSVRLIITCQRPDASAFPDGSRINYGIITIVGAPIRSIYEMLIPKEYIEKIGERNFEIGEGVVLLQGAKLKFIKVPMVRDIEKMQQICIEALTN